MFARVSAIIKPLVSILACCSSTVLGISKDALTVNTTTGHFVGFVDPDIPHVRQFTGLPYAEPPLGNLRFLPPRPKAVSQYRRLSKADSKPPNCMYWFTKLPTSQNRIVTQFNPTPPMSEDCLYVNVFAPSNPVTSDLPMFIWIHGGQWIWGGIETPYEQPQEWVERTQDVIVIQINYRLNVFGFPNARGLKNGERNAGFMDMRKGIEWARDNAAAFGGNPERMVLWGQSAGAASVDMLQFGTHAKDPIVKGVIAQSAVALLATDAGADPTHLGFTYLAQRMGCPTATAEAELKCMRTVDARRIEHFLQNHTDSKASPTLHFVPAADNTTVFTIDGYKTLGAAGNFSKLPMLVGSNSEEFAQIIPLPPGQPSPNLTYIHNQTIEEFQCPLVNTLKYRNHADVITYRYYYGGNFTNISPTPWLGAYHFAELPLLTGKHSDYRSRSSAFEYKTSHTMQKLWRAFAMDPARGLAKYGWPTVEHSGEAMEIAVGIEGTATANVPITRLTKNVAGDASCD